MGSNKPRVVSLFAGAGGMDLGFIEAGFKVVWANELSPDACATYRLNVGRHLVEGDIGAVPSDEIPACEVVIGGPPCQGFSVAGKMDPDDPRSQLVWEFIRVVRDKRPVAFVMENVKALAHLSRWAGVRQAIVSAFGGLGYDVACAVLDASRFGAPQLRERAFFIGTLRGRAADLFPAPAPQALSARAALQQLPRYGTPGNDSLCRAKVVPAKNPVLRHSPYAGMLFNGLGRPIDLDRPAPTLPASMGGNKTPIIDQRSLETGEPGWVVRYHARLMKGGRPLRAAPRFLRRLTVEECAAIQTFPAAYRFAGRPSSRFCQIGNAVPPALAQRVAEQLLLKLFPAATTRARGTGVAPG